MKKTEHEKRLEISSELDSLAMKMRSIAAKMEDLQDANLVEKGNKLSTYSDHAREWAKFLRAKQ